MWGAGWRRGHLWVCVEALTLAKAWAPWRWERAVAVGDVMEDATGSRTHLLVERTSLCLWASEQGLGLCKHTHTPYTELTLTLPTLNSHSHYLHCTHTHTHTTYTALTLTHPTLNSHSLH